MRIVNNNVMGARLEQGLQRMPDTGAAVEYRNDDAVLAKRHVHPFLLHTLAHTSAA
jgi:hypothetical protein